MANNTKEWAEKNNLHYEPMFASYSLWTHEEKIRDFVWGEFPNGQRIFIFKITIRRGNVGCPGYKTYFNGRYYYDLQYDLIDQCENKVPEEYHQFGQEILDKFICENESKGNLFKQRGLGSFNKVDVGGRKISFGDIMTIGENTGYFFPLEVIFGIMGRHYVKSGEKIEYKKIRLFYDQIKEFYFSHSGIIKIIDWKFFATKKIVPYEFLRNNESSLLNKLQQDFGYELSKSLLDNYKYISDQSNRARFEGF